MSAKIKIKQAFQSDWSLAAILLVIFFLTHGYTFGWDDQHLEVPLLKSLIDNGLYPGDYYIESLKSHFVSFLYPILARIITVDQIPMTYFILFVISRYFLLFWVYRFWKFMGGGRFIAFMCSLIFLFSGRVPEFLYRTFSHQEFILPLIMAGLYFFYKERFIWACALWGIAANFHFLYSFFLMSYLSVHMLRLQHQYSWKSFVKSITIFIVFSLPVLIWIFRKRLLPQMPHLASASEEWLALYRIANPENFIFNQITLGYIFKDFGLWLENAYPYILLSLFYVFHQCFNARFRSDSKTKSIFFTAVGFFIITYFFTYVKPSRFVIDMNIVRNKQFLFFLFSGYTFIFIWNFINEKKLLAAYPIVIMFCFLNQTYAMAIPAMAFLIFFLFFVHRHPEAESFRLTRVDIFLVGALVASLILLLLGINQQAKFFQIASAGLFLISLICMVVFARAGRKQSILNLEKIIIIISVIVHFSYGVLYHLDHIANIKMAVKYQKGFWAVQNDWEHMQLFVRDHTSRDAYLLAPYNMEMGGFRIYSERKILACYRDCGLIGFDYNAALEWQKRIEDIKPFKIKIAEDITPAIRNAISDYGVNYIVFMRYAAPEKDTPLLKEIYKNKNFSLFQVNKTLLKYLPEFTHE